MAVEIWMWKVFYFHSWTSKKKYNSPVKPSFKTATDIMHTPLNKATPRVENLAKRAQTWICGGGGEKYFGSNSESGDVKVTGQVPHKCKYEQNVSVNLAAWTLLLPSWTAFEVNMWKGGGDKVHVYTG